MICWFNSKAAIIYVKNGGVGNGVSWQQAYGSLNVALQNAVSGDEIWVAQGTYYPSSNLNSTESFIFKDGVKLYGGFLGNETLLSSRADTSGTTTILSGVLSSSVQTATLLKINNASNINNLIDGFTILGAKRIMVSGQPGGAGLQILNSTIQLKNCIIKDNRTELLNFDINQGYNGGGSAIFSLTSNLVLDNVNIIENSLDNKKTSNATVDWVKGGAIYVQGGSFDYNKGRIENNEYTYEGSKGYGGAGYFQNVSLVSLKNLFVYYNKVSMKNMSSLPASNPEGGAFYFDLCNNILMDTNIFHGNYSSYLIIPQNGTTPDDATGNGDAVCFSNSTGIINNVTFGNNTLKKYLDSGSAASPSLIYYAQGTANLTYNNCVFLGIQTGPNSQGSRTYYRCISSNPIGVSGDPNNRWAEMEFVNVAKGDYTPRYCSVHLNFSDLTFASSTTDINGNPRVVGTSADPGAVEFQYTGTYNRVYVDHSNTNAIKDGISWGGAFNTLQEALSCKCKDLQGNAILPAEIWVAQGTYKTGKDEYDSFFLNNGQKVYGGFKTGDTLLVQRDSTLLTQQTILSGKYDTNKHATHVVSSIFTYIETELNSFIVQDGQTLPGANGDGLVGNSGAGIYVRGQATLKNLWIRNNKADGNYVPGNNSYSSHLGGGIFVYRSDGTFGLPPGTPSIMPAGIYLENTKITNNTVGGYGAGIAFLQFSIGAAPVNNFVSKFKNVQITDNESIRLDDKRTSAGAIYIEGRFHLDIEDFDISNNKARSSTVFELYNHDGGIINLIRGKIDNNQELNSPTYDVNNGVISHLRSSSSQLIPNTINMESVVFSNNKTKRPAIGLGLANLNITNCTFVNNSAQIEGNLFVISNVNATIKNSIIDYEDNGLDDVSIWTSNSTISSENNLFTKAMSTKYINNGNNKSNTNPLFVDKANGDYNLMANSPAIDAGKNSFLTLSPNLDAISNNRIHNNTVDLGAFEFQGTVSITEQTKNAEFVLYPNPAESEVFLQFDEYQKGNVIIYNLQGKKVLEVSRTEVHIDKPVKINVENLQSGTYIVKWFGDQFETSVKLIKK